MASRTFQFGPDAEAAFAFLGKQERPPVTADQYVQSRIDEIVNAALVKADSQRFEMLQGILKGETDKGKAISTARELLGL